MKTIVTAWMVLLLAGCATHGPERAGTVHGLKMVRSVHGVKETIDRLEAAAKARGLNVFARIDHAAGAQKIGRALRPTELLIFGNPQGGTPLMECAQTAGIDLPLKALAWQDAGGAVWLGLTDPRYLMHRHRGGDCRPAADNVARVLDALSAEALKP